MKKPVRESINGCLMGFSVIYYVRIIIELLCAKDV